MSFTVTSSGTKRFGVARFLANGLLDDTFNGTGYVTLSIGSGDTSAYSVAIQNDGKILVAGSAIVSGNTNFAVVRYNSDGSLDDNGPSDATPSDAFGTSGISIVDVSGNADVAYSIALQADQEDSNSWYCE